MPRRICCVPGGLLACELYEGHLDQAAALCRAAQMSDVRIVNDLTNRPASSSLACSEARAELS
ncbi:MAG: hypothetical protein ACLTSX_11230 [Collinsella sp.]